MNKEEERIICKRCKKSIRWWQTSDYYDGEAYHDKCYFGRNGE